MIIFKSNNIFLEITESVVSELIKYRQISSFSNEAGGVLIGKRLLDGNIVITDITTPQPKDIRKRAFFRKSKHEHQVISDDLWKQSRGIKVFVGEWHTHPEKNPNPSFLDKKSWKKNIKVQIDKKNYIFVIVGTEEIKVWISNFNNFFEMQKVNDYTGKEANRD